MRCLRPAMAALLICAPALLSPALAQTCLCPQPAYEGAGPPIQAEEAPPPLPEYEQPPLPAPGYYWTPGYWAWNNYDYYWVPGVWVEPPHPGLLWTPGYWGFANGAYLFHRGYWGAQIGFYGGIHYGFGYNGLGYEGGRWQGDRFFYNSTVNNISSVHIANIYREPVTVPPGVGRASFNGGQGGVQLKPTPEQERFTAQTKEHIPPTPLQRDHVKTASMNAEQFQSANQGKPPVAATPRPGEFKGRDVVPAKAAGTAATVPNAEENQRKPGEPLNGEKPIKAEPLNNPKAEEKLPGAATPPGGKQPGAEKPVRGELTPNKEPIKAEPLNNPKAEEKLPGAPGKPEKPVRPELKPNKEPAKLEPPNAPKAQEKPPGAPADMQRQQELKRQQQEQQQQLQRQQEQERQRAAQRPPGAPGAAERNARPEGKREAECGKPGQPPCPR